MALELPKIEIRQGVPSDLDGLEGLYNDLHDHLSAGPNYPGWIKGFYPARETAEKGLAENNLYIAFADGRIAGSVVLNHRPEEAYSAVKWGIDADDSQILVVHTFLVHPGFSGMGVGKHLLDFSVQLARQKGMKAIRLDVYRKNTPAIGLYEKCGFRYVDTVDLGYAKYGLDLFKLYEKIL